ncbi:MAG: hypothetical protein HOI95_02060 [Chromatiales bacterium]|jgi:hypothetical protein|nr:hypothetical protein [Chromatiales bacterium]
MRPKVAPFEENGRLHLTRTAPGEIDVFGLSFTHHRRNPNKEYCHGG